MAPLENEIRQLHEKAEPLLNRSEVLWQKINSQQIDWAEALITRREKMIYWKGRKFHECVKSEIDQVKNISSKIGEIGRLERLIRGKISKPEIGPAPRPPAWSFQIRDQLKTFSVVADRIDRTLLMSLLEKKKMLKWQEQEKKKASQEVHQDIKAKARAYDDKQREYAKSVRNKIKRQLHDYPNCPYCGIPLLISQAHADHIYPVALGGLSTARNMVFVCQDCNQKKKTRTLREFIKEFGLDEHFVNNNLEQLRKKF